MATDDYLFIHDREGDRVIPKHSTPPAPTTASLIRREDIVAGFGDLVATYRDQQKRTIDGAAYPPAQVVETGRRLSSADELAERRKTATVFLVALVLVVSIAIAGAVMVAAPKDARFPMWLLGTGLAAGAAVAWLYTREQALTPEALERDRQVNDWDIARRDAKTRRILAEGQVAVWKSFADADVETRRAQLRGVDLDALRIEAELEDRRDRRRRDLEETVAPTAWRPSATVGETVVSTEETVGRPFRIVGETVAQLPAINDPVFVKVAEVVAGLYDQVNPDNPLITVALPWSARSTAMSPAAKDLVVSKLASLSPPLIESRNGRYYLNVAFYQGSKKALRTLTAAWRD